MDLYEIGCAKLGQYRSYSALYLQRDAGKGQKPDVVYLAKEKEKLEQQKTALGGGVIMTVPELIKQISTLKNSKEQEDRQKYEKICERNATKFFVMGDKKAEEAPSDQQTQPASSNSTNDAEQASA